MGPTLLIRRYNKTKPHFPSYAPPACRGGKAAKDDGRKGPVPPWDVIVANNIFLVVLVLETATSGAGAEHGAAGEEDENGETGKGEHLLSGEESETEGTEMDDPNCE